MPVILPGADAWSTDGSGPGSPGALCIHGFTGNPTSMRPVAEAFAAAGFAVELPRLPGHGTTVDDMLATSWDDWSAEAEAAYQRIATRASKVVVAGLSMGGTLTVWLAENHPEIAGIVAINAAVAPQPPEVVDMVKGMVDEGQTVMPGIGSDIAKPGVVESAYEDTPLAPLLSLVSAVEDVSARLGDITCPVLIMTSPNDHVVDPTASDLLAAKVSGPVERVTLERSFHVATVDYDAELIQARAVEFGKKVTA
jgi:carboxylesterase